MESLKKPSCQCHAQLNMTISFGLVFSHLRERCERNTSLSESGDSGNVYWFSWLLHMPNNQGSMTELRFVYIIEYDTSKKEILLHINTEKHIRNMIFNKKRTSPFTMWQFYRNCLYLWVLFSQFLHPIPQLSSVLLWVCFYFAY